MKPKPLPFRLVRANLRVLKPLDHADVPARIDFAGPYTLPRVMSGLFQGHCPHGRHGRVK
jgi:hypothetical protein